MVGLNVVGLDVELTVVGLAVVGLAVVGLAVGLAVGLGLPVLELSRMRSGTSVAR